MTRREAREKALCLIYEYGFNAEKTPEEIIENAINEREENLSGFAKELFLGVCSHLAELDEKIAAAAENWRIERIGKVTLAVLRLGAYELLYKPEIGMEISINEALELTKKYDEEKAVGFVNGILGKIANA
ncbi:MAG TPA: transcription antitermination factor NusB [Bacillota bacterium]|nr:transcription antitermination factor NusB [Bacillota bacterium]HOK68492.1 transcription antitermination factor NusB [Bacillota bacterium]HPP85120.1 transcription antitermination factor NusB [Bacillota bacterium]